MFVASHARLPAGFRFYLSVNVLYGAFAVTIWVGPSITVRDTTSVSLHYGSGPLVWGPKTPPKTGSATKGPPVQLADALDTGSYRLPLNLGLSMRGTASVPLEPSITMCGTASVPLGPPSQCAVPPRYRSGHEKKKVPTPRLRFTKF